MPVLTGNHVVYGGQEMRQGTTWGFAMVAVLMLLSACAPLPRYTALPVDVRPSPNFGERRPNYVILHHTTNDNAGQAVATLTNRLTKVSAHYLIGRDGRIIYLVDELKRAWHAGDSYWGGNRDINSSSIGIELDNNGNEPFSDVRRDGASRRQTCSDTVMWRPAAKLIRVRFSLGGGSQRQGLVCGVNRLSNPCLQAPMMRFCLQHSAMT
jgi:hypothetical protein